MTKDTLKSLGYLKKSLKMSKRAVENNKGQDGVTDSDFAEITTAIDDLVKKIFVYETIGNTVTVPVSPTVDPNPNPSTSAGNPVPPVSVTSDASDNDLLTT